MSVFGTILIMVWMVGAGLLLVGFLRARAAALAEVARSAAGKKPDMLRLYFAMLWAYSGVAVMMVAGSLLPCAVL